MKETCLILGGAGFIGSHIAEILLKNGFTVRLFDRINRLPRHLLHERIQLIEGDFLNFSQWDSLLKDVDYIFHNLSTTIPSTSDNDPVFDIQTNVIGNVRFLHEVIKHKVKKIIFSSSGGTIYGNKPIPITEKSPTDPICSYGISKLSMEKYLHYFFFHHNLDYVSLRYSNVYGPGQDPGGMLGAVTIFLSHMIQSKPVTIFGDGNIIRDYIYISDIQWANLLALKHTTPNHIYNVGTGIGTSINELIAMIVKITGLKAVINRVPARREDVSANVLDISLIKNDLGWRPKVTLQEGIAMLWSEMQETVKEKRPLDYES